MPNHLARETSPYLLQHANNPVDWYPWGPEALDKARLEDKPIFVSIGYAACHWCHVMAHESFEDSETAALMNASFVNIKVDREERPDLDSIYMAATQALTGSGGWPMSVFLTPDLRPFYAGTYFPPVQRYNMPSFKEVLSSIARAWREQRDEITRVGGRLQEHLAAANSPDSSGDSLTPTDLDAITASLLSSYDWGHGGWGSAPKFPQPMLIEYLLRRGVHAPADEQPLKAARHALLGMARGGMYDVVGGGFARYSTDNFWRVPHFEKMLYDNAQLARAYLHMWQIDRDPVLKDVAIRTLDFVLRELTDASGGFYSSLDADSESQEGKFYVWAKDDIRSVLGDGPEFELFSAAYGLTDRGNWEGKTVLQRALDDASLAAQSKLAADVVRQQLSHAHKKLLAVRSRRVRPGTDDKVLTSWNGLTLQALAEASRYMDEPQLAQRYADAARRNAEFLLIALRPEGRLRRNWRAGTAGGPAFLEDYASLILGLLALYQADFDVRWFAAASSLANEMVARFADPAGGFFDTPADRSDLLLRPKDLQDNATPSGSALASEALLTLAAFTGRGEYHDQAAAALSQVTPAIRQYPTAFGRWLNVADLLLTPGKEVALVYGEAASLPRDLLAVVNSGYRPNMVLAASQYPPPTAAPALLEGRVLKDGKPTAYVCQNFVCRVPVNSPAELEAQLQ